MPSRAAVGAPSADFPRCSRQSPSRRLPERCGVATPFQPAGDAEAATAFAESVYRVVCREGESEVPAPFCRFDVKITARYARVVAAFACATKVVLQFTLMRAGKRPLRCACASAHAVTDSQRLTSRLTCRRGGARHGYAFSQCARGGRALTPPRRAPRQCMRFMTPRFMR